MPPAAKLGETDDPEPVTPRPKIKGTRLTYPSFPLQHEWCFYFDDGNYSKKSSSARGFMDHMVRLGMFSSIEDFWSYFNSVDQSIDRICGSRGKFTLRLFKNTIKPVWEDEANKKGGRWIIKQSSGNQESSRNAWLELVLAAVGERLPHGELVCGCVLTQRNSKREMHIWTGGDPYELSDQTELDDSMRKALRLAKDAHLSYISHRELAKKKKDRSRVRQVNDRVSRVRSWPLRVRDEDGEEEFVEMPTRRPLPSDYGHLLASCAESPEQVKAPASARLSFGVRSELLPESTGVVESPAKEERRRRMQEKIRRVQEKRSKAQSFPSAKEALAVLSRSSSSSSRTSSRTSSTPMSSDGENSVCAPGSTDDSGSQTPNTHSPGTPNSLKSSDGDLPISPELECPISPGTTPSVRSQTTSIAESETDEKKSASGGSTAGETDIDLFEKDFLVQADPWEFSYAPNPFMGHSLLPSAAAARPKSKGSRRNSRVGVKAKGKNQQPEKKQVAHKQLRQSGVSDTSNTDTKNVKAIAIKEKKRAKKKLKKQARKLEQAELDLIREEEQSNSDLDDPPSDIPATSTLLPPSPSQSPMQTPQKPKRKTTNMSWASPATPSPSPSPAPSPSPPPPTALPPSSGAWASVASASVPDVPTASDSIVQDTKPSAASKRRARRRGGRR